MKKTYPSRYPVKVRFSRSVAVGEFLFVSGCSGQTLETFHASSSDPAEQTLVALDKIRGAVEEAGGDLDGIAKMVVYLTRLEDGLTVEDTIEQYLQIHAPRLLEEPPTRTVVCVPGLHEPDLLVELEVVAVLPNGG